MEIGSRLTQYHASWAGLVLLLFGAIFPRETGAGQICANCRAVSSTGACHATATCSDSQVCHMTVYKNVLDHVLHDYGCTFPQSCHHSVGPSIIGRRANPAHHDVCIVCCNNTRTCNDHLTCDISGTSSTTPASLHMECSDLSLPVQKNGVYTIYPSGSLQHPVSVYCYFDSTGQAWTVIQRRFNGSVDFYRNWQSYKDGFGSANGEYWIGNDNIHQLTGTVRHELRILMSDFDDVTKYAQYSTFQVSDESHQYKLLVQGFTGNTGDDMTYHSGQKFSTFDRDNDGYGASCAKKFDGAWWYWSCHYCNLNGLYLHGRYDSDANGIFWREWHGPYYSMKTVMMMIRKY